MLRLKPFRDKAAGVADLLNWSHLVDSGIVLCKDGSLLAGWFYRAPDIASRTDGERNWLSGRVNAALARLAAGWASWIDAVRLPASSYPEAERSHFPDPVSRLVDAERRAQFLREGSHYEGEYAIVVQFTPPLRRKSKLADLIYDDDPAEIISPANRILEQFKKALGDLEDAVGDAVSLRRMESYTFADRFGRDHLRDHLVNYLHFALTGEEVALNVRPAGAYLDAVIGGRELWAGDTPRLGSAVDGRFICCVAIEGFPAESFPGILDMLDHLPIARHAADLRHRIRVVPPAGLAFPWHDVVSLGGDDKVVTEDLVARILERAGLPVARGRIARTVEEALQVAEEVGYKVAMKAISSEITHRAAAGLVALDIGLRDAVAQTFGDFSARAAALGAQLDSV